MSMEVRDTRVATTRGIGVNIDISTVALFVFPLKKGNEITGVVEIALFAALSEAERQQAAEAGSVLGEIS